jgi:threonine aldolase
MDGRIDLRSDTVSQPSERMRHAMAMAEVGDDWYGDDPTVNLLQERAAELTGKQAAIYLPTGTMCTQIALHAYVRSGHLAVCESSAHAGRTEASSAAAMSGIAFHYLPGDRRGLLTAAQVAAALAPDPYDVTVTDLVTIENTHQVGGGSVMPVASVKEISAACATAGVPLYLDGARIFNACAAAGAVVGEYAAEVSSLMFCLSKGLGAPVGSVLAGDREFIREARRLKILFGAGWRQAGIVAAAGLIALAEGPERLAEDHANARALAAGLAELLPGSVDPAGIETNIVFADVSATGQDAARWRAALAAEGLLVTIIGGRIRMLTHVGVSAAGVQAALAAWRRAAVICRSA